MIETHERVVYSNSADYWDDGEGSAVVLDASGQQLLDLPLEFLRRGKVDTFAFILQCVAMCFETAGQGVIRDEAQVLQEPNANVLRGCFIYTDSSTSGAILSPRRGPRFKFKSRPPHTGDDDASTMSNSRRSTLDQSKFRLGVVARDYYCLVSGEPFENCTAAHILPVSRAEYYEEVLNRRAPIYLYLTSYGVLLRDDLHHAFDRGHIALYPLVNGELVVHIFHSANERWKEYHGTVIKPSDRFRGPKNGWPNEKLLLFHYQQCAIKCLRGWSAF